MSSQMIFEPSINNYLLNSKKNYLESIHFSKNNKEIPNILTHEEVENLVTDVISSDAKLIDYELKPYSKEKIGFLGAHLCLVVQTRISELDLLKKYSFFVKTLPYDVQTHAAYVKEKGVFQKETGFFRQLVPFLMKNFKGETWLPQCYLIKDSTIVFEDLKLKGFSNRSKLFDEESARLAIACIARFHASSLLAEERLNGKALNEVCPEIMEESEFKSIGQSYTWFITAINLAVSIAETLGLDASNIHTASQRIFDIGKPSQNKRNVISHGDLWSGNLLFDDKNHCNLVDFQTLRYVPLGQDVIQLIYLTLSRQLREKCERKLIEYYYAILIQHLTCNNFTGVVPTFNEVLEGVEEQRLLALITATIFFPTVLMDGKTAAKVMDNPTSYETYHFKDRKPFVDKIMAEDCAYEYNLKETVKELAEMSLKLNTLPRPT